MKRIDNIRLAAFGLLTAAFAFVGCQQEEIGTAKAVMASVDDVTFAAQGAEAQTISVYADGEWIADVAEDWATVSPMTGVGNTEVVITVEDNVLDGIIDTPRKTYVYFRGSSAERQGKLLVIQKGDAYKGVQELSVSEVVALEDEKVAKIPSAQVAAVTTKGFVVTDGKTNMYVDGAAEVTVGDVVFLNGAKATINGLPAFKLDEFEVKSHGEVSYPTVKDVTSTIDSYQPKSTEYIQIDGSLVMGSIRIPGAKIRVTPLDTPESLGLAEAELHKVSVKGFFGGIANKVPVFYVASIVVGDVDESVVPYPVKWSLGDANTNNFNSSWIDEYTTKDGEVVRTKEESEMYVESVQGLGYITYIGNPEFTKDNSADKVYPHRDVNANHPRITGAWTGDYWLFRGLGAIKAGSKVQISFEFRTSATNPKYWELQYKDGENWKTAGELQTVTEPFGAKTSFTHATNADGATNVQVMEVVTFNHNNSECNFRLLCKTNLQANEAALLAQRNGGSARIAVTDASNEQWQPTIAIIEVGDGVDRPDTDPVRANIEVSEDVLAFEGKPAAPKKLTVKSDYDFTVSVDAEWLSLDVTEGAAGEDVDINVTCEETTLSTLRQATIKIVSADSKMTVPVVQSAAGQDLDPFVALGSNNMDIAYKGQTLKVKVQSNADYTITSDVDWIATEPFTKGLVNKETVELYVLENDNADSRTGTVRFTIADKGVESVLTVNQAGKPASPATVIFEDDFSWLAPFIAQYNAANPDTPIGATVEGRGENAPNAYTTAPFNTADFAAAFAGKGYVDPNDSDRLIYPQDEYLKFSRTKGYNTGLQLSLEKYLTATSDITVAFDFCMMCQGDGTVDEGPVVVQIVGDGTFADGKKVSEGFVSTQEKGKYLWNHALTSTITGATSNTKLVFLMGRALKEDGTYDWHVAGAGRFFLDNIRIEKAKAAPKVIFQDNFDWLKPLIDEYNAANATPVGNAVEGHTPADFAAASGANAPNAYTAEPFKSKFAAALAEAGYEDMNAGGKVIYPQDTYLKFGKTSVHTSLKIKSLPLTEASNLTFEFDWCRHVQGSAIIDPCELVLVITGDGMFENGQKVSAPLSTAQTYVQKDDAAGVAGSAEMFWTHANVKIEGANANTQINIVYKDCLKEDGTYNWTVSGAHRYHIDNIKVTKL